MEQSFGSLLRRRISNISFEIVRATVYVEQKSVETLVYKKLNS